MNESAPKIEQSQLTPRTTYDKSAPLTEEQQKLAEGGYQQVKDIAFRMFNQGENQTFQLGDFIVWGTDGLLEAARKFDASKNSHFSVYAAGIIRGRILDNIQRERMISRHHFEFLKRREQARNLVSQELVKKPTEKEIADKMGLDFTKYLKMVNRYPINAGSLTEKENLDEASQQVSYDKGNEEFIIELLYKFLDQLELTAKELQVIKMYFIDKIPMKDIGIELGMSESRVSQIKTKVVSELKNLFELNGYRVSHKKERIFTSRKS